MTLRQLVTVRSVRLRVQARDWEEAVRIAGMCLVEAGKVESRYVDAMVNAVKTMGPYMVIAPGVALAHARPEDGVLEDCLSVVSLRDPVYFGSQANDPVDLVLGMGARSSDHHVEFLSVLAEFLMHEDNLKLLRRAKSVEEVYAILGSGSSDTPEG